MGLAHETKKPLGEHKVAVPLIVPHTGDDLSFTKCGLVTIVGGTQVDVPLAVPPHRVVVIEVLTAEGADQFAMENLTADFLLDGVIYRPRQTMQPVAPGVTVFEELLPQRFLIENNADGDRPYGLRFTNNNLLSPIHVRFEVTGFLSSLTNVGGDV